MFLWYESNKVYGECCGNFEKCQHHKYNWFEMAAAGHLCHQGNCTLLYLKSMANLKVWVLSTFFKTKLWVAVRSLWQQKLVVDRHQEAKCPSRLKHHLKHDLEMRWACSCACCSPVCPPSNFPFTQMHVGSSFGHPVCTSSPLFPTVLFFTWLYCCGLSWRGSILWFSIEMLRHCGPACVGKQILPVQNSLNVKELWDSSTTHANVTGPALWHQKYQLFYVLKFAMV